MSIKLRTVTDTTTTQLDEAGQIVFQDAGNIPLTATEVDNNFVTLKQKIDEIEEDYDTTFNPNGTLKDGAITTASISDGGVTSAKIKDRAVDWSDQRNILYLTDTSADVNKVDATLVDYLSNTGLTALPPVILAFKAARQNVGSVTLTLKNKAGESDPTTLISLPILKQVGTSLGSGDIMLGGFYLVFYDGTTLQLINSFQDPTVTIEENVSAVATFGPIEVKVSDLATNDANLGYSHGLSQVPTTFDSYLVCLDTEHNYDSGDIVPLDSLTGTAAGAGAPIVVRANASDIIITKTDEGLKIPNADDGDVETLTEANWKIVVRGTYRNDNTYSPAYVDRALDYVVRRASGALTVGNYLYYFSSNAWEGLNRTRLRKINLITNEVFDVCGASVSTRNNHLCNPSYIRFSDEDTYKASGGVIVTGQGGTGYSEGDILTLSGGTLSGDAASTFKVTAVTGGVIDTVDVESGGAYEARPDDNSGEGVTTTGGNGDAKISVTWTQIYDNRLYWSAPNLETNYIVPNGLDTPEQGPTNSLSQTIQEDNWEYAVQEYNLNKFWALRNRQGASNDVKLYSWAVDTDRAQYNSGVNYTLNFEDISEWRKIETNGYTGSAGNVSIRHIQWNPVKKRLYVINNYAWVVHVLGTTHTSLKNLWDHQGEPAGQLTYVKTVGIPGGIGDYHDNYYDGYWIDTDTVTGEEKSITISRYGDPRGSVTRAAWREG